MLRIRHPYATWCSLSLVLPVSEISRFGPLGPHENIWEPGCPPKCIGDGSKEIAQGCPVHPSLPPFRKIGERMGTHSDPPSTILCSPSSAHDLPGIRIKNQRQTATWTGEVEGAENRAGFGVEGLVANLSQAPIVFNEAKDRGHVLQTVVDEIPPRKRREHEKRQARAIAATVLIGSGSALPQSSGPSRASLAGSLDWLTMGGMTWSYQPSESSQVRRMAICGHCGSLLQLVDGIDQERLLSQGT